MQTHVQRHCWSREAGGVLLGRLLVSVEDVVVDEVTVPGAHERRSRFRFFRAQQPTQTAVNHAWARSGGAINYLGEWHTHPEDYPTPSLHDCTDWQRLVGTQRYEQNQLFFVIVGRRAIRAWELGRGQSDAASLTPMTDESLGGRQTMAPRR